MAKDLATIHSMSLPTDRQNGEESRGNATILILSMETLNNAKHMPVFMMFPLNLLQIIAAMIQLIQLTTSNYCAATIATSSCR